MGVSLDVGGLEARLRGFFEQREFEEVADCIVESFPLAIEASKAIVPDSALPELTRRRWCNWPHGSGYIYSEKDRRLKELYRQNRYGYELELLEAQHPRRVARLWKDAKPRLEKRYRREFSDRRDFATMNGILEKRGDLGFDLRRLRESVARVSEHRRVANRGGVWKDIYEMWRVFDLEGSVLGASRSLLSFMFGVANPDKLGFDGEDPDDRIDPTETDQGINFYHMYVRGGPHFEITKSEWGADYFGVPALEYFTGILLEDDKGELGFGKAFDLLYRRYAEVAKMKLERPHMGTDFYPEQIKKVCYAGLKKGYDNRESDSDFQNFAKWFVPLMLRRWKATAVDHTKLFDYHVPSDTDERLISLFYSIRDGKRLTDHEGELTERVCIERIPGVLRTMIADGIISEDQVDPPLQERYLGHDEVLSVSNRILEGRRLEDAVQTSFIGQPALIETSSRVRAIPDLRPRDRLVVRDDLSALADILSPEESYYLLYRGDHVLFLSSIWHFPSGKQGVGDVFRIAKLRPGAEVGEGVKIVLRSEEFHVRGDVAFRNSSKIKAALYDSNVDLAPARAYTAIVDISPDEFKEKYFKDFMAHVYLNGPYLDASGLEAALAKLDEPGFRERSPIGINTQLGFVFGKTNFRTFELDNRFCFRLRHKDAYCFEEVFSIAQSLTAYLDDVGLRYHSEVDLDEAGRGLAERKIKDREFQREHWDSVVSSLKGNGLIRVLSFGMQDNRYESYRFGSSDEVCKVCGADYISGGFYRPDLGEQWCDHTKGEDLHALSRHPYTYVNEFGRFRRVHRLVSDAEGVEIAMPAFISHPDILPELDVYARDYMDYLDVSGRAYAFWWDTQGGITAEDEELEDDPRLRELAEQEIGLHENEKSLLERADQSLLALQRKYDGLRGVSIGDYNLRELRTYWSDQLMFLQVYQRNAPELIEGPSGSKVGTDIRMKTI